MPALANQRKGETMLRVELWMHSNHVVICICEGCAPAVLDRFAALDPRVGHP